MITIKRIYNPYSDDDGFRILVDRLWPRGVSKSSAKIDLWLREIAPTDGLRKWFGHEPEKWELFAKKYKKELQKKSELLGKIRDLEEKYGNVTLVFSARDEEHNNAIVLKKALS